MRMRKIVCASAILGALVASGCTTQPGAVRGIEAPGSKVVAELRVSGSLTEGMPPGSSSYVGASADGSLIGFLTADGAVRWYRMR